MPQGIVTKLGYRLCDWNGNTVIEPLPHPHQSVWQINGMQVGASGTVAIGNFTIPLYPPRSVEFADYRGIYSLIKYGMRVEAYVLDESGEYKLGIPCWSGIITKINKELDKYELQGFDSLWLAQQSQFYPGQTFSQSAGDGGTIDIFNDVENLIAADDFAGNNYFLDNSGGKGHLTWSNVIGAAWATATDDEGLPGWKATAPNGAEAVLLNNQSSANSYRCINQTLAINGSDSYVVSGWFHISGTLPTASGAAVGAELVMGSDAANNNGFMCRAILVGTGTAYNVSAEIWSKSAGTYTQRATVSVFTGLTGDFRCQVTAIFIGVSGFNWQVRVLINGKDVNCIWGNNIGLVPVPAEACGPRASANYVGATVFFSRFIAKARFQVWAAGSGSGQGQPLTPFTDTGSSGVGSGVKVPFILNLNGVSVIDLWSIGASAEGWIWRKDARRLIPLAGFTDGGDPISWGVQGNLNLGAGGTGVDLSKQVILREGIEVISGGALANAESLGTEVKLGFTPANNSGGQIVWPDVAGMLSLGQGPLPMSTTLAPPLIFSDVVGSSVVTDNNAARRIAANVGANKALSNAGAKKFTILRTPELAGVRLDIFSFTFYDHDYTGGNFQGLSPQAFRELDFVTLDVPSLDIFMQKVSVVSYIFREADPTFDVVLDQYAFHDKQVVGRRLVANQEQLYLTFASR